MKKYFKYGFTLAEVIIVMLIIGIILSVTIGYTQTKMSNLRNYNYYYAYATLKAVVKEIKLDYNNADNNYINGSSGNFDIPTLPRTGANFCSSFIQRVNTIQLAGVDYLGAGNSTTECAGSNIASGTTNFHDLRADFVLKNGMRVFGVHQGPNAFYGYGMAAMATNPFSDSGVTFPNNAGTNIDIESRGYNVFVDIDGRKKGNSTLWQDVYPFFITLSGKVIPAYNGALGAVNREFLKVGISNEITAADGTRQTQWILISGSFKEAACQSGFIDAENNYCSRDPAINVNANCTAAGADCRIRVINPVKWFN